MLEVHREKARHIKHLDARTFTLGLLNKLVAKKLLCNPLLQLC